MLVLACTAVTPAFGAVLLVGVLTLGLHGHAHSLALVADGGHLDLVVSHPDDADQRDHSHEPVAHPGECSQALSHADHVFHLSGDEAERVSARRVAPDGAPLLANALAAPLAPASVWHPLVSSARHARTLEQLNTVVLRL